MSSSAPTAARHTNRLIHATSPYLLQHAHNPVDWYPWGPEALERARRENKPIFLSIGYSACHWCHVMERESFESEVVARVMNELFVNIKVDREERPDLDEIYMTAVQLLTGSGGWPMSVWLTPDLRPFYGGTYFPPTTNNLYGRPGFVDVCRALDQAYREQAGQVAEQAQRLTAAIEHIGRGSGQAADHLDRSGIDKAVQDLRGAFDPQDGGFGHAPKFPPSMGLDLLLREYARTGDARLRSMADVTLHKMAAGGLYDQLGGGFARYSVDAHWLVPHFEKMLYDNALLAGIYLDACTLARQEGRPADADLFARIARETLDYVLRDMTASGGAFCSSEDADSEGREGWFYLWTPDDLAAVLGPEPARQVGLVFGVTADGNFDEHGTPTGKSILHLARPIPEACRASGLDTDAFARSWPAWRAALLAARAQRVRPGRDDKVLTAWNGLMIVALARGADVLAEPRYREAAVRAAEFILTSMVTPEGRLTRSARPAAAPPAAPTAAASPAFHEDYAFFADACLALYECTGERRWLAHADRLAADMIRLFHDEAGGGFFFTAHDHEALIARTKSWTDNAIPSGNSVAAALLLRLAVLLDRPAYRTAAEQTLRAALPNALRHPGAYHRLLCAADLATTGPVELALVGSDRELAPFRTALAGRYLPNRVLAWLDPALPGAEGEEPLPLLAGKGLVNGQAAVYVCRGFACQAPAVRAEQMLAHLPTIPAAP